MINLEQLKRISVQPKVGVYFLFDKGVLVYIGQSTDIHRRIQDHKQNKIFDSYGFVECDVRELDKKEKSLIKLYNPKYNITHNNQQLLPDILQTPVFLSFYEHQQKWTGKLFDQFFIVKLPDEMVYSMVVSKTIKGYSRFSFKDLKGEISNTGSFEIQKASGWFNHRGKRYWFEPQNGVWTISTL